MAVKQSGMIGKCPILIKVAVATREAMVVALAEIPNPSRNIPIESSRMARRP
jgi:hypothetical protein